MGHKDLRLGQIVYILVFYNISFSWLLPLDGFQCNFLLRDSENDLLSMFVNKCKESRENADCAKQFRSKPAHQQTALDLLPKIRLQ